MTTSRPGRAAGLVAALFMLLPASPAPLVGQATTEQRATNVVINSALGAVTAAVRQTVCGCRTWRGVAQGAAGGAVMAAGKQVAGSQFAGSGMVGRQLHALGVSAIASGGQEQTILFFPIGPVTIELRPGSGDAPRARVDVTDLAILGTAALDSEMRIDWGSTVSAGAPVLLHTREGLPLGHAAHGFAFLGTVFVLERFSTEDRRRLVAHESIHVLQWDALRHLATHPMERVVTRQIPGVRRTVDFMDLGLLAPGSMFLIAAAVPYHLQPWEREAYRLANGHGMTGRTH